MKNSLVSTIITTYKRDRNILKRALKSVLNQTYRNYEIIVVDDNGNNSSYQNEVEKAIFELNSSQKIKLIKHEKNLGAPRARNTGLKYANGEFIAFLDDDDGWLEKKLELQVKKFKDSDNSNLGLVYCWFYKYEQLNNKSFTKKIQKPSIKKKQVEKELLYKNFIGSTSFPLIKKECFDTVGQFDENLEAKQDYDMWIRISRYYAMEYVNEPLCNYYDHLEERITNNITKKIRAERLFFKKHQKYIEKDQKAMSSRYKTIGVLYLLKNDYKKARKYIKTSLQFFPLNYKLYILMFIATIEYKPEFIKRRL